MDENKRTMVHFVGAGPGAKDLITVRGRDLLAEADVVIYAGSLVNPELLEYTRETCVRFNSAKMYFEEVIDEMRTAVEAGQTVVRLHSGDPSLYGTVREQMDELDRLHIAYDSCPGVSACFGAASSMNVEYTLPGVSQSLIITRMEGRTKVPPVESIESFAKHRCTMAVYLSAGRLTELSARLVAGGYEPDTPAALVYKATWPEERWYFCTVSELGAVATRHRIDRTALVIVGAVLDGKEYEKSRLYDKSFFTGYRTL